MARMIGRESELLLLLQVFLFVAALDAICIVNYCCGADC
jgi:hypothetical protein